MSLRYVTALRRCENCRSKKACRDWLDYAAAMINFAPDFLVTPMSSLICSAIKLVLAGSIEYGSDHIFG
jgi:hypothetical protein